MIWLLAFGIALAVLAGAFLAAKHLGASEARAERAKDEAETTRKQAEILLEDRSDEDTANRLDSSEF